MSAGWSWSMVPQRLMSLDAFFELSTEERMVLLMLYLRCDRWGRGPAGSRALGVLIGVEASVAKAALPVLERAGLVSVDPGGWWQIVAYDDDAPAELIRRRGVSQYGTTPAKGPPDAGPTPPDAGPTPDVQRPYSGPTPGPTPDEVRPKAALDETRRDETETETRAAPQPGARGRARSVYEPRPEVVAAVARWQAAYARMVPTGMIPDESVLSVAEDFAPVEFVDGVRRHCDESDRAYWTRTPIKYLRLRCEWARRDGPTQPGAPPPSSPRSEQRPRRGVDRYGRPRALTIAESDEIENERRAAAGEPPLPPRPTKVIELFGAEAEECAL